MSSIPSCVWGWKGFQGICGLEPRLNLRYLLADNSSMKFSYNRGYQYLFVLSNTVAMAPTDQWKLVDYHIRPQYLDQISAGYYQDFPRSGMNASVEYTENGGIIWWSIAMGPDLPKVRTWRVILSRGEQKAYGVETMFRRNTGALNGWLSYTYSRSFMQVGAPGSSEKYQWRESPIHPISTGRTMYHGVQLS